MEGLLLRLLILLVTCCSILSEKVMGEVNEDFDFDGLPGIQHEFKVEVNAGREECFYQNVKKGAQLHVSFEVLRGADRNIDFTIKEPKGGVLDSHLWTSSGSTDKEVKYEGHYAICIDNSFSRFSSKLVYFYLVTYVPAEWDSFTKELEEFESSVANSSKILANVDQHINHMLRMQAVGRQHIIRDWYIIYNNNNYVQRWSIVLIVLIFSTGGFQVFFVRRLFRTHNVSPTSKPRA